MNHDSQLSGVIAAVPTPYDRLGQPDIELFLQHCHWALDNGCDALNLLGTTGEANSLDLDTRIRMMHAAVESSLPSDRMMVGTGTPSLAETIRLTALAADLGFAGALILPPYYYKPVSDDGLFAYFSEVINAVKDKNIAIYLYNFPLMTGIQFSLDLIARLISSFPDHMKGIKDSSGNLDYDREITAAFGDDFSVFPSSEVSLLTASVDGFAGCISASVNVTGTLAAKIWCRNKNDGQDTGQGVSQEEAQNLIDLRTDLASLPIVQAVKALIATRENMSSWQGVKPPLMALNGEENKKLKHIADRLGYRLPKSTT